MKLVEATGAEHMVHHVDVSSESDVEERAAAGRRRRPSRSSTSSGGETFDVNTGPTMQALALATTVAAAGRARPADDDE